ncbi:MAG: hypothetical protein K2M41_06995 [Muribaculaceae bacterium]|nr:hypothetical protein [Muribaculaceae bacterium]
MRYRFFAYPAAVAILSLILTSCSGRTEKNMVPTGETIEVVIPEEDQAEDATIANGGIIEYEESPMASDTSTVL